MKRADEKSMIKKLDAGSIVLGKFDFPVMEIGLICKFLFRCKKDNFDFLGQAGIDIGARSLRVEVFNKNYYTCFESAEEQVHSDLENKILVRLFEMENISEPLASVIGFLLGQKETQIAPDIGDTPESSETLELQQLYDRLNQEYFGGKIDAKIQWGRNTLNQNSRSVRFGSYDFKKKLIRINPRLKQDFVPLQILEHTVYHEMCHQFLPPFRRQGKRIAHHAEFKQKEKEYKFYGMVKKWERQHWKKLMAPDISNAEG